MQSGKYRVSMSDGIRLMAVEDLGSEEDEQDHILIVRKIIILVLVLLSA